MVRRIYSPTSWAVPVSEPRRGPRAAEGSPRRGRPVWPLATIGRLLRNEAYVGRLFWNRTRTSYDPSSGEPPGPPAPRGVGPIPVPAIVTEATFESVQQAASANTVFSLRRTEPARSCSDGSCVVATAGSSSQPTGPASLRHAPAITPARTATWCVPADRTAVAPSGEVHADELDAFVFDQVRQLLARPDLLSAGEAAAAAQRPVPDDELLATSWLDSSAGVMARRPERRRLADLYQAGVIDSAEMARRASELDARRRHLDQERQALVARGRAGPEQQPPTAHHRLRRAGSCRFGQFGLHRPPTATSPRPRRCARPGLASGTASTPSPRRRATRWHEHAPVVN